MPPTLRQRPSRRRERGLKAQAIVLGRSATPILHEGRTTHLVRVKSTDVPRRYAVGQRLAIKEMVPGPTACNVILFDVKGPDPKNPFYLGHVTRQIAKELGHHRLDAFWRHWLLNHDQEWMGRTVEADQDTDDEIARRFNTEWSEKLGWLLRFTVDRAAEPRLLAARSDELYVSSEAMALKGELPALTVEEWDTHIGPKSRYREQDRLAERRREREAKAHPARLAAAKAAARGKSCDISREVRLYEGHVAKGKPEKALRQLELIEARVFPQAA